LRNAARAIRRVAPHISVVSPLVLPAWGNPIIRAANNVALWFQASLWRFAWGRADLIIVYAPAGCVLLPPLRGFASRRRPKVVYHCVDDIAAQPDMPSALIHRWEEALIDASLGAVTTSPELTARVRGLGASNVLEQTNVVDYERFADARERSADRRPSNVVGFVGALSPYKFDFDLVFAAARCRPHLTFQLYGPVGEGEAGADTRIATLPPNVVLGGYVPSSAVPSVMAGFDVAIIPTPHNRYTRSMFPMKFFEYLAVGLPVVASELPALASYREVAFLTVGVEAFVDAIDRALAGEGASRPARLALARSHTYETRTMAMLETIDRW
jgi:glycosyltransferase involved in cell wall biosynthesis